MIINIRGASGAGKSWVMRQVMADYPRESILGCPAGHPGKPCGYILPTAPNTFIVGSYEVPSGGCDQFKDLDDVDILIDWAADQGFHVLFEGIRVNGGVARWVEMVRRRPKDDIRFLLLNTTLDDCVANVVARRKLKGKEGPIGAAYVGIEDHHKRLRRFRNLCKTSGYSAYDASSADAVSLIKGWIGDQQGSGTP